jgi:hypothetical protein
MSFANRLGIVALCAVVLGCGGKGASPSVSLPKNTAQIWNLVATDANKMDYTPPVPGETRVIKQQAGPGKTSRAFAIIHIAMFDAVNSITKKYRTYTNIGDSSPTANVDAACAQAAHDTLVALFSAQASTFDSKLVETLAAIPDSVDKTDGIAAGQRAALLILSDRATDGSATPVPYTPSGFVGRWAPDPINPAQTAVAPNWGQVRPFVLTSGSQFRCPPMPALTSPEFARAYNEMLELGGDGITTPTARTAEQTEIGIFWGYDGTVGIGTPPRIYNQIAATIVEDKRLDLVESTRLFAMANTAMADEAISNWESKYFHDCGRPVTVIRSDDGNPATVRISNFTPMGAQLTNGNGNNFTPAFPSYPSGHAGFGGAFFQTLRNYFRTDNVSFTQVSDELNGVNKDNRGRVRPMSPRSYGTLSQAELEDAQSRIFLGIHWNFDRDAGNEQGNKVGDYVTNNAFRSR